MRFPNLLDKLVRAWMQQDRTNVIAQKSVDLIVPVSYGTLPRQLALATFHNLQTAIWMKQKWFPEASIALSNCAYVFPGAAEKEKELRGKVLRTRGILDKEVIWADEMNNTIQETQRIKEAILGRGLKPRCILVITCAMHSRSAKYIWKKKFPGVEILVYANDWGYEAEPGHPTAIQRSYWLWFTGNIARQLFIRLLGLDRIGGMHHRASIKTG